MSAPSVLTVILNYRTAEMTLRSLAAARVAMQGINGEIVVVDNASGDGSFEKIRDHVTAQGWLDVRVLASPHNGGFGAGNNVGFLAGLSDGTVPDYLYALNSDAFPEPDAIHTLLSHLEAHPKTGFAGSHIVGEDGESHMSNFRFPSIAGEFEGAIRFGPVSRLLAHKRVPMDTPVATGPVEWTAGASLMIRAEMLRDIALFDETYFLYFEETDLCLRGARAGYACDFVRESRVMHIGSVSTGMKKWQETPSYWFDSRLHYFTKNYGVGTALLATVVHVIGGVLHRLRQYARGQRPADPPKFLRHLIRHTCLTLWRGRRAVRSPNFTSSARGSASPAAASTPIPVPSE